MNTDKNRRFTTELFNDRTSAEKAYQHALQNGYTDKDINVLMSEDSRKKYYDSPLVTEEGNKSAEGLAVGGTTGAVVGGIIGAVAAIGTSLVIPGLGLIVAGPLAAGLAGAGAGSITGGLVGALIGWGIPEEKARVYESGIKSGGIVLGVNESADSHLERDWKNYTTNNYSRRGTMNGIVKSNDVVGVEVRNRQNENLGKVEEIMLDKVKGTVKYVVLSFGGFLGMGDKLFAMPWSIFSYDNNNDCFVIDVDKEKLKNSPGFDNDNWPNMEDATWNQKINDYYGTTARM